MNQPSLLSVDTRFTLNPQAGQLPFTCELSLEPLIAFWQQAIADQHPMYKPLAGQIRKALRQAPALMEPIRDLSVLTAHRELVATLMTAVFPAASWDEAYTAALIPFHFRSFFATPGFERLMLTDDGYLQGRVNVDEQTVAHVKLLHTYAFILFKVYDISLDFDYPLIFTATDPDTGLDRHFRMNFDGRFMQVKTVGDVKPLTPAGRERLLANLTDPQILMELVPPDQFVIQGFAILSAVEVTDQEVLSALKRDLIEKEIISNQRFDSLKLKLRTLFQKPDLGFGLAAIQGQNVLILNPEASMEYG